MLALRDWARNQSWLSRLYRCLPVGWRERVSQRYVAHMAKSARFPPLPPVKQKEHAAGAVGIPVASLPAHRGVNLFAYFRGQFGLAEAARSYAGCLIEAGYPVALYDIDIDLPHGFDDPTFAAQLGKEAPYPINLVFVNPDYFDQAAERIGQARMAGRYVIACWFWELESVPTEWLPAIEQVDEIMVASRFVEQAFRRVTNKPITRIPLPVSASTDSGLERADFGLGSRDFLFLTSFDFHSWVERKNPFAVVEAFQFAFPDRSLPVRLLIKTINGLRHPEAFSSLLKLSRQDPRILVRDEILDGMHLRSLQRCCDAYVSLHRAEGFGLGLAECMRLGKPVIATGWSGNLDFMSSDNSCLVAFDFVDIGPGEYLHGEGQRWAAANTAEAASHMRRLFSEPCFARDLGDRAANSVASELSPQYIARQMVSRFDDILIALGAGSVMPASATAGGSKDLK